MTDSQTGSTLEENPLASLKWLWKTEPPTLTHEPLISTSKPKQLISTKLEPLKPHRKMMVEFVSETEPKKYGYLRLTFDSGLRNKVEALATKTLEKDRKRKPSGQPQKHGWAGQFAFEAYLNFFAKCDSYDLIVHHDNPEYSPHGEDQDFIIRRPQCKTFRVEIKTSPPYKNKILFCKYSGKPFPTYLVAVKAVNDSMTIYDVYGFMLGSTLKTLRTYPSYGKACSTIPLNRHHFDYYNFFHEKVLGLPYYEKFN